MMAKPAQARSLNAPDSWESKSQYHWDGPGGMRVCASWDPRRRWVYTAWGPEDKPDLSYWKWHEQAGGRVQYPVGAEVPSRRACLGFFPTPAEARQACLAWMKGRETGGATEAVEGKGEGAGDGAEADAGREVDKDLEKGSAK